jgi:hypothetical protein
VDGEVIQRQLQSRCHQHRELTKDVSWDNRGEARTMAHKNKMTQYQLLIQSYWANCPDWGTRSASSLD